MIRVCITAASVAASPSKGRTLCEPSLDSIHISLATQQAHSPLRHLEDLLVPGVAGGHAAALP